MSQYQSFSRHPSTHSTKKKRSLLFDRVQTDEKISDFKKYIHKNVNIYYVDQLQRTILMFTAQNYHKNIFKYLLTNYPKLITKTDSKDMNIMHYIASSTMDDSDMIDLITNKKFTYNKLVWYRDIHGNLPKDISKQCSNTRITKAFERIMHDTWAEYHHFARRNNTIQHSQTNNIQTQTDNCDSDLDMNDTHNKHIPYRSITICTRKRPRHSQLHRSDEYCNSNRTHKMDTCQSPHYSKRRKLNSLADSGSYYIRTTPTQPEHSPSPLPPLPPIQLNAYGNTQSQSPLLNGNTLPLAMPKLLRSRAVEMASVNTVQTSQCMSAMSRIGRNDKYQIIGRNCLREMEEISHVYYNGNEINKSQFMFVKWYQKRIGNMRYLPVVIDKGFDDLNKFMALNREKCMQLFGDGMFKQNRSEMSEFNDRMRHLQLSPESQSSHSISMERDRFAQRSHLISDNVMNSSDSNTNECEEDNVKNSKTVISFPWAMGQCEFSEDDDL